MTDKECIILENQDTRDKVVFIHAYNEDNDEVYAYANNTTIMSINYDEYCDMLEYYSNLNYISIMHTIKAFK